MNKQIMVSVESTVAENLMFHFPNIIIEILGKWNIIVDITASILFS